MNIDKIKYSVNTKNVVSFKADENKALNSEPKADKEKSNAMLKMVGLTALAAAAIGGIVYAVKSGNTSKVTQGSESEVPELIKKILRKDGTLARIVEKQKDGQIASEQVFAKDGTTLKYKILYKNGKKSDVHHFMPDGKTLKGSFERTSEGKMIKKEYYYDDNSIFERVYNEKHILEGGTLTDLTSGQVYKRIQVDSQERPILETLGRRKDGKIYEQTSSTYLNDKKKVTITRFNPENKHAIKRIISENNETVRVENFKKGKLYKTLEAANQQEVFHDLNNGKISRVVDYGSNGEIKRIRNFNTKDKEPEILSEIVYVNGKPQSAVTYTKGGAASKLTYDENGAKDYKEIYSSVGLQSRVTYGSNGKKTAETLFCPEEGFVQSQTSFYPNGKIQEVKTFYKNSELAVQEFYTAEYNNPYKIIQNNENGQLISIQENNSRLGFRSREVEYYENINSVKPVKKVENLYDDVVGRQTKTIQYNEKEKPLEIYDCINGNRQRYVYNEDGTYFRTDFDGKIEKFDSSDNSLGEYILHNEEFIPVTKK